MRWEIFADARVGNDSQEHPDQSTPVDLIAGGVIQESDHPASSAISRSPDQRFASSSVSCHKLPDDVLQWTTGWAG